MKIAVMLCGSGLTLMLVLGVAIAQSLSRAKTHAEMSGQIWLTNYYGKTLSSLGDIVTIRIGPVASTSTTNPTEVAILRSIEPAKAHDGHTTNRTHTALWRIIEHSKIQDFDSMGVAVGLPPVFSVEYADGLRVRGSHYTATITLPDGREGPVVLDEEYQ